MKVILYSVVVVCFLVAGVLDICQGHGKEGLVAILLGVANFLIFLWR